MHEVSNQGLPAGFDWQRSDGATLLVRYRVRAPGPEGVARGRIRSGEDEGVCGCPHAQAVVSPVR